MDSRLVYELVEARLMSATREFTIVVKPAICKCTNTKHGHGDKCEREEASPEDHLCDECHKLASNKT